MQMATSSRNTRGSPSKKREIRLGGLEKFRRSAMLPLLQQPQLLPVNSAKLTINDAMAVSVFFGQQILL